MSGKILLVARRPELWNPLQNRLAEDGFPVTVVRGGAQALPTAAAIRPDVVLLDLPPPGIDGFEICRRFRADRRTAHLPIMILSEEVPERDKVRGFEAGADDFVTRPFGLSELVARLKALLRHAGGPRSSGVLRRGRIELDLDRQSTTVGGRRVHLAAKELALLRELMSLSGLTLRRSYLLDRIWNDGKRRNAGARAIDTHIVRLRQSLGSEGRRIVTVRGVGYRFETGSPAIGRTRARARERAD